MKKKAIKIAASTAVAASAFVAAAPAQQADAATNVNQLATNAQNAGTVLKWAISYEGSADFKTRPYDAFNAAKKAVAAAETAAAKLPATEKLSLQAKLVDAKVQIVRATAYIDAITSSEKIKGDTAALDAAIKSNDIEKVEAAYHKATAEYRKQAALLDRVYGQSTRDGIRNAVKPAIEKLVADVKNDVTVNMLAKAAAADVKANKLDDASKKIAEANSILSANVLKWETALQKSVDDVATSLPLIPVAATYVDANTITVKLSKKVDTVNLSQFTIDGLIINSVSLGDDKQTVTLKTGTQAAGKAYVVEFNGKTVTYSTPASGAGTIGVDKNAVRANVGDNVAVQASFKEKTGQAYSGQIRVTAPEGTSIVTINGKTPTDSTSEIVTPNQAGTVTVVLTSTEADASVNGEKVKFEKIFNDATTETSYSGDVYFYLKAAGALADDTTVNYVDAANKYFVVKDGENLVKYSVKSIDAFTNVNDNGLTLDQFFAALTKGDEVTVPVYGATTTSASHFKITFNKTINDFGFASKYFVLNNEDDAGAYRVDTNGKWALEGEGQPGYTVYVTNEAGTEYTTTVKSNGTWSVEVNLDQLGIVKYAAVQTASGEKPNYANAEYLNVREGAFLVEEISVSPRSSEDANALLGRTITLTDSDITVNDSFVPIKSGASITLTDDDGTRVKYTHGQNAEFTRVATDGVYSTVEIKITKSQQLLAPGTQSGLADTFSIESVSGLTNSYGLLATPTTNALTK